MGRLIFGVHDSDAAIRSKALAIMRDRYQGEIVRDERGIAVGLYLPPRRPGFGAIVRRLMAERDSTPRAPEA